MAEQAQVASSPETVCPILNGMKIPQVKLRNSDGAVFDLSAVVVQKLAILVFYRGGW